MAAVLQEGSEKADRAQHRRNVTQCLGAAAADVTASQERSFHTLHLPFLVLLTCLERAESLFLVDTGTVHLFTGHLALLA